MLGYVICIYWNIGKFVEQFDNFLYLNCFQSKEEKHFIHNHLAFTVKYHKDPQAETTRIVGFEVKPFRSFLSSPCTNVC